MAEGIEDPYRGYGIARQVTGNGSLRRVDLRDTALWDFRPGRVCGKEADREAALTPGLFEEGVIISPTGIMASSTPIALADLARVSPTLA